MRLTDIENKLMITTGEMGEEGKIQFSSVQSFSHVWLCVTPWTAAHQAPLSRGFFRQEYWSGLPFPSLIGSEVEFYLFIYLFRLCWVFVVACGLSLVVVSVGSLLQWLFLQSTGSRHTGSVLSCLGLVALWHVGSSQPGNQTRVSCIASWILYHRVTKEAPNIHYYIWNR